MAIVWQQTKGGKHYEVRNAGASLRLYTNSAFHSQYNPRRLLTGAVWDLLTVPTMFSNNSYASALLLGLGGGTAIHQLRALSSVTAITALELDPVHVSVARRFFRVPGPDVELVTGDAIAYVRSNRKRYDVVIDDIFVDAPDDPARPHPVDAAWIQQLIRTTSARGVVIQNHLSPRIARGIANQHHKLLNQKFSSALLFTTEKYENGVLALYREPASARALDSVIERIRQLDATSARMLRISCEQVF